MQGAGAVGTGAVTDSAVDGETGRNGGPWDQPGMLRDIYKLGLHTPWTASGIYSLSCLVLNESIKLSNSFSFYMVFY